MSSRIQKKVHQDPKFYEVRSVVLVALDFLAEEEPTSFKQLPWLNGDKRGWSAFRIRKNYVRDGWQAYRRAGTSTNMTPGKFNRWDILSLYGDAPIPAYFDFDRYVHQLDSDLQSEILAGKDLDRSQKLAESHSPGLFDLLKRAVQLQSRWASETFLQPLALESGDGYHDTLYGFSGYLLDGLILMEELIRGIRTGVIFRPSSVRRLNHRVDDFLTYAPSAPIRFADHLFFHNAILKVWRSLGGKAFESEGRRGPISFTCEYKDTSCLMGIFQKLYISNPVSIMMGLDIYSDMGLLEPNESPQEKSDGAEDIEEEKPSAKNWNPLHMDRIFQAKVCRQTLCQMADYLYDGLMAACPREAATCFGTRITSSPRRLFGNRIAAIVRIFNATFGVGKGALGRPGSNIIFWIQFFNLLLDEWLSDTKKIKGEDLPLPIPEEPLVFTKVRLSYFCVDSSHQQKVKAIKNAFDQGDVFAELAGKFGQDHATRAFGGEIGWVASDNIPGGIHGASLLGRKIDAPFYIIMEQKHHFFLIHEFEFAETRTFIERVIEQAAGSAGKGFRNNIMELFKSLDQLAAVSKLEGVTQTDLMVLKERHHKAHIYIELLRMTQPEQ